MHAAAAVARVTCGSPHVKRAPQTLVTASLRRRTHIFISVSRSWAPGCESKVGASRREESRVLAETRRSEGQGLESPILGPSACVREGQGGRAGCHIHAEAGYGVRLCPGRQLCTNADSSRQSGGLRSGPVSDGSSLRYIPEAVLSLGTGGTVRYGPPPPRAPAQ